MAMTSKETAAETLALLEARLRRLDFMLNGNTGEEERASTAQNNGSAAARLLALERSLQSLAAKSPAVSDVLALQRKHPDLFHPSTTSDESPTLATSALASLVLAHSQLYQTTAARLTQLQDFTIPDPASATKFIELQPRIEKARAKQLAQAEQFAELRGRSAKVVEAWYEGGVLAMDERWAEWEERLRDAEILVRRREAARKREEGLV